MHRIAGHGKKLMNSYLENYRAVDEQGLRIVRQLPKKLEHLLAVNEVRLHLTLACAESAPYALDNFLSDADLARERHRELLDLVPDGKVSVLSLATGRVESFLLEVDLGTEAVTWVVRHKLSVYARHAQLGTILYGLKNPALVFVAPSLRRARNVAKAFLAAGLELPLVFALRDHLSESNVLGAAYALPQDLRVEGEAPLETVFRRRLLP